MILSILKALHIIGFVVWFAGLFYLVRLLVYHAEAQRKPGPQKSTLFKQYSLMETRLYNIITWPGLVMTVVFGFLMVVLSPAYLQKWLYIKLGLVGVLVIYHLYTGHLMRQLQEGASKATPYQLRLWNEGATLLLVLIVVIAVLQQQVNYLYLFLTMVGLIVLLYLGVKGYKQIRSE